MLNRCVNDILHADLFIYLCVCLEWTQNKTNKLITSAVLTFNNIKTVDYFQ